jgi:hypothetical protein
MTWFVLLLRTIEVNSPIFIQINCLNCHWASIVISSLVFLLLGYIPFSFIKIVDGPITHKGLVWIHHHLYDDSSCVSRIQRFPPIFTRSSFHRLYLQSLAPTNPRWALVVGYGPFSLKVIIRKACVPAVGALIGWLWLYARHYEDYIIPLNKSLHIYKCIKYLGVKPGPFRPARPMSG